MTLSFGSIFARKREPKPEPTIPHLSLFKLEEQTVLRVVAVTEEPDPTVTLENVDTGEQWLRWASDSNAFRHLIGDHMARRKLATPVGIELHAERDSRTGLMRLVIHS